MYKNPRKITNEIYNCYIIPEKLFFFLKQNVSNFKSKFLVRSRCIIEDSPVRATAKASRSTLMAGGCGQMQSEVPLLKPVFWLSCPPIEVYY